MLGEIDHLGYLARDMEAAIEEFCAVYGVEVKIRFERPEFALVGCYLGDQRPNIEIFCFSDPALMDRRLGGAEVLLDHVAFAVTDIDGLSSRMRAAGVEFCGPDQGEPAGAPFDLGGTRHLWTRPAVPGGQALQLLQRPAA